MTIERLLSVDADMTIDIGDDRVLVRGDGSSVVIEVPSLSVAFALFRDLKSLPSGRQRLANASQFLSRVGLTVVVRTPHRKLMTIGRDGNSRLLKLFGVPNARLHLS